MDPLPVSLLMTRCHQIAPNCTDLHPYFPRISGADTPHPHNRAGTKPPPGDVSKAKALKAKAKG